MSFIYLSQLSPINSVPEIRKDGNHVPSRRIQQETQELLEKQEGSLDILTSLAGRKKMKTARLFRVHDWSFLREDPKSVVSAESQARILRFLTKMLRKNHKSGNEDSSFFVPKEKAVNFLDAYIKVGHMNQEASFPSTTTGQTRLTQYYAILLRISNDLIDLEGYQFFCRGYCASNESKN
jgi:hypothetical protein